MPDFSFDKLLDKAKGFLNMGDEAADVAEKAAGAVNPANLLDTLGKLGGEEQGLLSTATRLLGGMDTPIDIMKLLGDGKIDLSDVLQLGGLVTKFLSADKK